MTAWLGKCQRGAAATRWIAGAKATSGLAASPSQMGRFETKWLTASNNLSVLANLSGQWIKEGKGAIKWIRLSCV